MKSYYLILRIRPEDLKGKTEEEIIKKIEANYKALIARDMKMLKNQEEKEKDLKEMNEAREILSDPKKREIYDKQLTELKEKIEKESLTIEIMELSDELIEELELEIQEEDKNENQE